MTRSKALALTAASLMIAAATTVAISVARTRHQATVVINELRALSVASNPMDAFDAFQWKYGRDQFKYSQGCTFHFCTYEVDISNELLARLHLVPFTEMKTLFGVNRGRLITLTEFRIALRGSHSPVVHIQEGTCADGCGVRFDVNPHGKIDQRWNGLVEFNPNASAAEKNAALSLNIDCFHRVAGCKDIADLLPSIWKRTGTDSVSSQFVGLSQRLEESHGTPSSDDY